MCKLAGVIKTQESDLTLVQARKVSKALTMLLKISSIDQVDGSGYMSFQKDVKDNYEYVYDKTLMDGYNWSQTKDWEDAVEPKALQKMLTFSIHTRYATVGANSEDNSHPFEFGDIILMQNGTQAIGADVMLERNATGKSFDWVDVDVDTAAVAQSISLVGIDETFKTYGGAGVFVWMDTAELSLNIVKNDKRKLSFAIDEETGVMFYATEVETLRFVAMRCNLDFSMVGQFKNGVHYKFNLDEYSPVGEVVMELEPLIVKQHVANYYGGNTKNKGSTYNNNQGGTTYYTASGSSYQANNGQPYQTKKATNLVVYPGGKSDEQSQETVIDYCAYCDKELRWSEVHPFTKNIIGGRCCADGDCFENLRYLNVL